MTAKTPEEKTKDIGTCLTDGTYPPCCCLRADCPSCALAHLLRVLYGKEATITTLKRELDEAFKVGAFKTRSAIADYFDGRGQEDLGMSEDLYGEILDIPLPTPEQEGPK